MLAHRNAFCSARCLSANFKFNCRDKHMRTSMIVLAIALFLFARTPSACHAEPPVQAYHRTPGCIDGNCVPNRGTNGYHATRWRPWPGGEPTTIKATPSVGIEPRTIQVPPRDDELDMPFRPSLPGDGSATEPSPNDKSGSGMTLPPDLRNLTPARPVEQTRPDNSNVPKGSQIRGQDTAEIQQPILLGKKPEPLRLRHADSQTDATPSSQLPMLKVRPADASQSGLVPEMVPWNNEDKNPIVRQAIRITSNQVQQTIRLDEAALPDADENRETTIRVQHQTLTTLANHTMSSLQPTIDPKPNSPSQDAEWHSSRANAPAILPQIDAQPLPQANKAETTITAAAAGSPLRGISQGNPLRR